MVNLTPGFQLGPYRLIEQIGQGGMATVYKAYHAAMDRYVALKILPIQFAQQKEFVQRFEQEARTIAKLEHAHILPVYDFGEQEGITYLVMRYLDAGTLKDRIQNTQLTLSEIDRLFTQLASALAYAHEQGVLHRDIKPSNAMVNTRGELFLTDFGIAKLLESTAQLTATGALTGTPAYMSPEQAQGDKLDVRSDIYSLGIVLYEMVTGKVPFEAETPLAVILKQITAPLPPPTALLPELSPAIEQVILKALAKDRADRFSTCDEFLTAWKNALTQVATLPVTPPLPVPPPPTMKVSPPVVAEPTQPHMVSPAKTNSQILSVFKLLAGAVGVFSFLIIAGVGAMFVFNICPPTGPWMMPPWCPASPTIKAPTPVAASPTNAPNATSLSVSAPNAAGWTSWTAVNNTRALAFYRDQLVSGGAGLNFWQPTTGRLNKTVTANLPSPQVTVLFVDTDSSLWVGTENGLVHVVDENWTTFGAAEGLGSTQVTAIARVGQRLLVGTAHWDEGEGLYELDGKKFKKVSFPSKPENQTAHLSNRVTALATDKKGNLWVGTTTGLGKYDGKTWTRFAVESGLPHQTIQAIYIDVQDRLWAGTAAGAAQLKGERFERLTKLGESGISEILADAKGQLWFTTYGGLGRLNPATDEISFFDHRNSDLPADTYYSSATRDVAGTLYFGTTLGIYRYGADGKFVFSALPNVPLAAQGYSTILRTPRGELWFVERYEVNVDQFADEQWTAPKGLCTCQPLAFDNSGNLWGRQWDQGVWAVSRDGQTKTLIGLAQGLPSTDVNAVSFLPNGTAVVATHKGLAFVQNGRVIQTHTKASAGFAEEWVATVLVAADRTVWIGTGETVSHLKVDNTWEHFLLSKIFNHGVGSVFDLAQTSDGALWVATGNGVYQYKSAQWQEFLPSNPQVRLPSEEVRKITVASDGVLWFATPNGAATYDGKQWTKYLPEAGKLLNGGVNDIFVSPNATVWFATNAGVSRYKP